MSKALMQPWRKLEEVYGKRFYARSLTDTSQLSLVFDSRQWSVELESETGGGAACLRVDLGPGPEPPFKKAEVAITRLVGVLVDVCLAGMGVSDD